MAESTEGWLPPFNTAWERGLTTESRHLGCLSPHSVPAFRHILLGLRAGSLHRLYPTNSSLGTQGRAGAPRAVTSHSQPQVVS